MAANNHHLGENPSHPADSGRGPEGEQRTSGVVRIATPVPESGQVSLPPGVAVATGRVLLSEDWHLELPSSFWRRRERGSLVLWRPALTLWVDVADHDAESARAFLEGRLADVPRRATELRRAERGGTLAYSFRLRSASAPCPALHALIAGPQSYVHVHAYFDHEAEAACVRELLSTVACAPPFPRRPLTAI